VSALDAGFPHAKRSKEELVALRGPAPAPLAPRRKSTPPLVAPLISQLEERIDGAVAVEDENGVIWQPPAVTLSLDRAENSDLVIEIDQRGGEDAHNEMIMRFLFGEVRLATGNSTATSFPSDSRLISDRLVDEASK
jgi:hypothetical protein